MLELTCVFAPSTELRLRLLWNHWSGCLNAKVGCSCVPTNSAGLCCTCSWRKLDPPMQEARYQMGTITIASVRVIRCSVFELCVRCKSSRCGWKGPNNIREQTSLAHNCATGPVHHTRQCVDYSLPASSRHIRILSWVNPRSRRNSSCKIIVMIVSVFAKTGGGKVFIGRGIIFSRTCIANTGIQGLGGKNIPASCTGMDPQVNHLLEISIVLISNWKDVISPPGRNRHICELRHVGWDQCEI